jgi:glycosyltransferase involved in cell wall biosynthesis
MKIAQIVCVFPPYKGGIGQVAYKFSEELSNLGHKVTVFTPDFNQIERKLDIKFEIHRLKPVLKLGNGALLPQLSYILKYYDIIHLHYPFFGGAEPIWIYKLFNSNVKLFIHYHMDVLNISPIFKILSLPSNIIKKNLFNLSSKITCASFDYIQNSTLKNYYFVNKEKFVEIPFGVDLNFFKSDKNKKNNKNILFVGGLDKAHYFKGVSVLLKSFSLINNQSWKLNIVGDGDLKNFYIDEAKKIGINDKVIFWGKLNDQELLKRYQESDLFVLPSINTHEAFGLVLLEAMACGLPVIASNLPGVRSVFKNGNEGFLVKPGDVNDLQSKINTLISNEKLREMMGIRGRKLVEKKYDWIKIIKSLENLYQSVL